MGAEETETDAQHPEVLGERDAVLGGAKAPGLPHPGNPEVQTDQPPENPVSASPASRVGTKGASSVPPTVISDQASIRVNRSGSIFFRNG